MNTALPALRAFLGDPALHARYLERAREVERHNTAVLARMGSPRDGAATVTTSSRASASTSTTTTSARSSASGHGAAPIVAPSAAALEAALAAGTKGVGRPMSAADVAAAIQPQAPSATAVTSGPPRGLWLPGESEHADFVVTQLGLPKALAELIGNLALFMPRPRMPGFALECVQAITPGADLTGVASSFVAWMFHDRVVGALRFKVSPDVLDAAQAVGWLHAQEARGQLMPRADWAAARQTAQMLQERRGSDNDGSVSLFAADAAWSCATSRSVALQSFQIWQWALATLPVHSDLGYSRADLQAFNDARDAFWRETAELRRQIEAAGEPIEKYEALFQERHPQIAPRYKAYAERSRAATDAMAHVGGEKLLALLRAAPQQ